MLVAALFTKSKVWKQPKCPLMDEWKRRRDMKKNDILPFATAWMDPRGEKTTSI